MGSSSCRTVERSCEGSNASSNTMDLSQPRTIASSRLKGGRALPNARRVTSPLSSLETVGTLFGRLMVIDAVPRVDGYRRFLHVRCTTCGAEGWRARDALRSGRAGCRPCGSPTTAPLWLEHRCLAAKQRCTNPKATAFNRYGARGIRFKFQSPIAMARWVQEHLGLHPELQIDRVKNDGHYEPGNLRWATPAQNLANSRRQRVSARFHAFRLSRPAIRYADATLRRLLLSGLTDMEIIARFNRPSCKPKGVYGTFSTPDPVIASQLKDS